MKAFFGEDIFLHSDTARALYDGVKDLPIVDYHCHLDGSLIKSNAHFSNIGELWLGGDHYKWRAMRLCDVDEYYITGDAPIYEKYLKFAEIFPKLAGNPVYDWAQLELALIFGIREPFDLTTAPSIWERANRQLETMTVRDLLKRFKVEYVATTSAPTDSLDDLGDFDGIRVRTTFRPDDLTNLDPAAIEKLAAVTGRATDTLDGFKEALAMRLEAFVQHDCLVADHGMDFLPVADCGEHTARDLYERRDHLTPDEKWTLSSHLIYWLAGQYTAHGMLMQMHFAPYRNVNTALFKTVGRDAGFDIMHSSVDTDRLVVFLDTLNSRGHLPETVVYSLNPACLRALCTLTGAFPHVRVGAAWWFNDTLRGIREVLETAAEYAALGTNLGMLTDSRSFSSYARFDFYRRILSDVVGGLVENGEYAMSHAEALMQDLCSRNIKRVLHLD